MAELPKNSRLQVKQLVLRVDPKIEIKTIQQLLAVQELRFKLILQVIAISYAKYPEQMIPNPIFKIDICNS